MKKLTIVAALLISSLAYNAANAQVHVSVNFNVPVQPLWGPTGYDYAQFYYLPDIGVYYNVSERQYVYNDRGRWVYTSELPRQYANFDLYRSYKVVINEPSPWLRDNVYRTRYVSYRGRHNQGFIRDSRDEKYWQINNHPHHNDWERRHGNGRNDDRGNGRGDDRNGRGNDNNNNDQNGHGNNGNGHGDHGHGGRR